MPVKVIFVLSGESLTPSAKDSRQPLRTSMNGCVRNSAFLPRCPASCPSRVDSLSPALTSLLGEPWLSRHFLQAALRGSCTQK
jgi:hypothetical protein